MAICEEDFTSTLLSQAATGKNETKSFTGHEQTLVSINKVWVTGCSRSHDHGERDWPGKEC